MKRRNFILRSSVIGLGFIGLRSFATACTSQSPAPGLLAQGYGPLQKDPNRILNLPEGFSYKIISKLGDAMDDGFLVPGLADGMAAYEGPGGKIAVIRNHEVSPRDSKNGPFGADMKLRANLPAEHFYDYGHGKYPCLGGTTTFIYNPSTGEVEKQWLSLAGTIRNCAGGKTPWNSWITCEETTVRAGDILEKHHGYNFEVPLTTYPQLARPIPIKSMGRFNHEAVCVDPKTSIVYQTEDRSDGLIYRFIPEVKGELHKGGRLQVLSVIDHPTLDTRNWPSSTGTIEPGTKFAVKWLDIDDVDAPLDDLRYRGAQKGAAIFARGEGMWYGANEFYFACTNGGKKGYGQVFRYRLSSQEGGRKEDSDPATLELFVESENSRILESCDNLTIASNGDLFLCEDKAEPRIVGVTPQGKMYHFGQNLGYRSEFAGATFSPDGRVLFVNIQGPGLTLAITGPWDQQHGD